MRETKPSRAPGRIPSDHDLKNESNSSINNDVPSSSQPDRSPAGSNRMAPAKGGQSDPRHKKQTRKVTPFSQANVLLENFKN
mmetsp:Transcript_9471/g.14531  ORF Transcript_9471/g.14531 Transcript_9471/m.14531 type:complete len:82 (+) Transcript_9471:2907-3152(+)